MGFQEWYLTSITGIVLLSLIIDFYIRNKPPWIFNGGIRRREEILEAMQDEYIKNMHCNTARINDLELQRFNLEMRMDVLQKTVDRLREGVI